MNKPFDSAIARAAAPDTPFGDPFQATTHVYEVVEETFVATRAYDNPYLDIDLWVKLTGPGGSYRIPAFWDGGNTFRVRLVATSPGTWRWSTIGRTDDTGLDKKHGTFEAIAWTEAEIEANPNRRGFIHAAPDQHTLEYADGTPFFYVGDTWWTALTGIYAWDSDRCLSETSFQKAVALRKSQGFNGLNIIACFPSDTLRGIWDPASHGRKVAEDGSTPFEIPDPEDSDFGVDFTRINPIYWQQADRKMQHLWDNGFAPFMESVRRSERWYDENPAERQAFVNYIRTLWARYGCYNLLFSWVHWDWDLDVLDAWKAMVKMAYEKLGSLPYGQPRTAMAWGSSLTTWCVEPDAVPLDAFDFHNVSNRNRDYVMYSWLREIYDQDTPKPGINIEPYYPGWEQNRESRAEGLNDAEMAQFQMYGSVLNGGFAGHSWGDTYYAGVATESMPQGNPLIPAGDPHARGFNHWCAASMGHLRAFVLDHGHDYRSLEPATLTHLEETEGEWRVLALSMDRSMGLGFVAAHRAPTGITDLPPDTPYSLEWWAIDRGTWSPVMALKTDDAGRLTLPEKPDDNGWAYRIRLQDNLKTVFKVTVH